MRGKFCLGLRKKCHHRFHAECLEPWLMKHDDCPCYRVVFIDESTFLEDDLDGKGNDENIERERKALYQ